MAKVYFVHNKTTGKFLNQKGEWSNRITSYRLAEFDSEAAAQAAFPAGVDCDVRSSNQKEDRGQPAPEPTLMRSASVSFSAEVPATRQVVTKFFVSKGSRFLDQNDEFKAKSVLAGKAQGFDSQDAALDKVEALGVDLDKVHVIESDVLVPAG